MFWLISTTIFPVAPWQCSYSNDIHILREKEKLLLLVVSFACCSRSFFNQGNESLSIFVLFSRWIWSWFASLYPHNLSLCKNMSLCVVVASAGIWSTVTNIIGWFSAFYHLLPSILTHCTIDAWTTIHKHTFDISIQNLCLPRIVSTAFQ